ncbi:MAG: SusC/RagA family TonB-linked outer membrane protein, partial [Bacteroidales bacterium]
MAGMTSEERSYKNVGGSKNNIPANDEALWYLDAATEGDIIGGGATKSRMISYIGRINYSYMGKYLLTANVRRDGSSQFADGYKWGVFPSFSAGWRISDEAFFKGLNLAAINSIKLRGGWGQLGNQNIPANSYITLLSGNNRDQYPFGTDEELTQGYRPANAGNPEIQWETHEQTNIGIDVAMFDSRLAFSGEYYIKNVRDMILGLPVPVYSGQPAPLVNSGTMQNKGLELNLEYHKNNGEFTYSLGANISFNKNKITSLSGGEPLAGGNFRAGNATLTEEGRAVSEFYGWKVEGVFQDQTEVDAANALAKASGNGEYYQSAGTRAGDFKFVDIDGNSIINNNDKTFIGSPHPDFFYGFNANLSYKNFELNMLFQGVYGNEVFFADKYYSWNPNGSFNIVKKAYESAWNGKGSTNSMFSISNDNSNNNTRISDWYVEDGSYLRLKNIELGYNIPTHILSKIKISRAKIYVAAENLFTITAFPGLDPETGENHGTLSLGLQQYIYPVSRTFMGGIRLTL